MKSIVVTGAGSAQSNGVINCLKMGNEPIEVIGFGSDPYDICLSNADRRYLVPHSTHSDYKKVLLELLKEIAPSMIHFQHDKELLIASSFRNEIEALGVKLFIPDNQTINTCVHKYDSWLKFRDAGIVVPKNIRIFSEDDICRAFSELGDTIWLRSMRVGGGGLGSFVSSSIEEATEWIETHNGWGTFLAAELLSSKTVTWQSVWCDGELIAAQGRRRYDWAFGALSASGVTGITRVCETISDPMIDDIARRACLAVSEKPHGVYGVDLTYDFQGVPNPTEINIGRFFTTVQFFAEAGLNLPEIVKDLCLYNKKPAEVPLINPLEDNLLWIRGMDVSPRLTTKTEMESDIIGYKKDSDGFGVS